ncbi:restriction endonuclease subunit S [Paenibacillus koleovorans]|uniref:restriction endonuclease subunit S n=1 Tax=Paenibacillus koleovorans TaxID=121608 RepID=UPI0015808434|nr:restriction endonuclease subunit S [Paenibacillus koleovorans]
MISVMDILAKESLTYEKIRNSVSVDNKIEEKNKVENGDLVFVRSSEASEEVGWAKAYLQDEYALYSGFSIRGKRKNNYDPYFVELSLNNVNRKQIESKAGGSTRFNVSQEILNSIIIIEPSLDEQVKISSFFKHLDHLITLHQRKLNNVKNLKAGLLQKMFPKERNEFPEVRFPEFTNAWEQRRLGELCNEFRSGEFIKASDISTLGDYPVYGGNGIRGHANAYNHDGEFALIGRQGALCGNMQYSYGKAYFTEHAVAVSANNENDTRFLYYLFGKMNLGQYSGQSAQPGLAVGNLIELKTLVPIKAEQSKISVLFSRLDHLITRHQCKLEHLQKQKKALLQQMFVRWED